MNAKDREIKDRLRNAANLVLRATIHLWDMENLLEEAMSEAKAKDSGEREEFELTREDGDTLVDMAVFHGLDGQDNGARFLNELSERYPWLKPYIEKSPDENAKEVDSAPQTQG